MFQIMLLRNHLKLLPLGFLALVAAGGLAHAQGKETLGVPSIMRPEPGSPEAREPTRPAKPSLQREVKRQPPARRVRGSSSPSPVPQYQSPPRPDFSQKRSIDGPDLTSAPAVPRPVPGFARVPAPPTSLSGQTFQDRAIGCVHYGTSQGIGAGQIGAYTGGCVNTR